MRKLTLAMLACCVLTAATVALADDVQVTGAPKYQDVRVTSAGGGTIVFKTPAGMEVKKQIKDVKSITLTGNTPFNNGETALAAGKFFDAITEYDKATTNAADTAWLVKLIRYRKYKAIDGAGLTGRAVEEWIAIMDDCKASAEAVALKPTALAAKGSKENDTGIALLEAKIKQAPKEGLASYRQMLLELYTKQGLTQKAEDLAKEIAGAGTPAVTTTGTTGGGTPGVGVTTPAAGGGEHQAQLAALAVLLGQSGQAGKVQTDIQANLTKYGSNDLPLALLLLGKAQMILAESAGANKNKVLTQAGVSLARVWVFCGSSAYAPEAGYLLGKVNQDIGNKRAAKRAYQMVMERYEKNDFAAKAKTAFEALGE